MPGLFFLRARCIGSPNATPAASRLNSEMVKRAAVQAAKDKLHGQAALILEVRQFVTT